MKPSTVYRIIDASRPPTPKIGVVAAVGVSTVDVRFAGGAITTGVQYNAGLVPAVGDRVLVVPADTAWVVVGKVSAPAAAVADQEVAVEPTHLWTKARAATVPGIPAGTWYYQWDGASSPYPTTYAQGRFPTPAGGPGWVPDYADWGTLAHFGDLAAAVPSGATITGMYLLLRRITGGQEGVPLVPPVLYAHAHDAGNPPPEDGPPTWVPGYGPLVYPSVRLGETTRVVLPSSFVTGLLSGTIKGIGFWSDRLDRAAVYWEAPSRASLIITHTALTPT
jgi:hypothetical protein